MLLQQVSMWADAAVINADSQYSLLYLCTQVHRVQSIANSTLHFVVLYYMYVNTFAYMLHSQLKTGA